MCNELTIVPTSSRSNGLAFGFGCRALSFSAFALALASTFARASACFLSSRCRASSSARLRCSSYFGVSTTGLREACVEGLPQQRQTINGAR